MLEVCRRSGREEEGGKEEGKGVGGRGVCDMAKIRLWRYGGRDREGGLISGVVLGFESLKKDRSVLI